MEIVMSPELALLARETCMSPDESDAIEILLVKDDAGDAERTVAALREGKIHNRVVRVEDGESPELALLARETCMSPDKSDAIEILLVEDDAGDAERTVAALREGKIHNRVVRVEDGEQALQYLFRTGKFARASRPDLVLLDWWLPKISGSEVLDRIKKHPELRRIPVVILTGSTHDEDVLRAYNSHANCFINKPVGVEAFMRVVRSIEEFWMTIVKLPAA
jgi:CheY-like chemotaxis protein